jgi:Fe-S cluster assembly protein SufB
MTHIGKKYSNYILKSISAGKSKIVIGLVSVMNKALGARNYSQCDSLLIGNLSNANTFPFISFKIPLQRLNMKLRPRKN